MGGRGASSSNSKVATAHEMYNINRIILRADTKGAVRFELAGNATQFRMTKDSNDKYTIKNRNRIYARNVTADEAKKVLLDTQRRFEKINEGFKKQRS